LEALLEKDPTNAPYLSRLCEINRVAAPAKALDFCRRAAEAQPDNIAHAVGFAAALVQARRFDQAIVLLSKLIAIASDNVTARANLAMAYFQLKRFREAKTEYAWIATRHPERVVVHFLLGVTHDNLGEYLDAMANYQQFLRVADSKANQLEIEKVNLRLPTLQKLIRSEKGKK
jgi:tetratricopeptide (TPR) repeat protein